MLFRSEILNKTISSKNVNNIYQIKRQIDNTHYSVHIKTNGVLEKADKHRYRINKADSDNVFYLCVGFEDEDGIYASIAKKQLSNTSSGSNTYSIITNSKNMSELYEKFTSADTFAKVKENVHTFWHNYCKITF